MLNVMSIVHSKRVESFASSAIGFIHTDSCVVPHQNTQHSRLNRWNNLEGWVVKGVTKWQISKSYLDSVACRTMRHMCLYSDYAGLQCEPWLHWLCITMCFSSTMCCKQWQLCSLPSPCYFLGSYVVIGRISHLAFWVQLIAISCLLDDLHQVAWRDVVLDALQHFVVHMPGIWSLLVTPLAHVCPRFLLCIPTALNDVTVMFSSSLFAREVHLGTCKVNSSTVFV